MMNLFAFCLVVTSLAVAGVWSPNPVKNNHGRGDDNIVKEVHMVIMVEFDKDGHGSTRVSISQENDHHVEDKLSSAVGVAKEDIKDAASVSGSLSGESNSHGTEELICHALGKCKHRIANEIGKVEDKASEKVHGIEESAGKVFDKTRERVLQEVHDVGEGAKKVVEKAKRTGKVAVDMMETALEQVPRNISEAKRTGKVAVDTMETALEHVARNISEDLKITAHGVVSKAEGIEDQAKEAKESFEHKEKGAKECVEHLVDKVKRGATEMEEKSEKELSEILGRGREVLHDLINYMIVGETWRSIMSMMSLLGFAMACGMCVWETFVSSYVLARAMHKQQFGMVQRKIYPVYFTSMAYSVGLALLGHLLSHNRKVFSHKKDTFQFYNLLASLLIVLANLLYLEPRAAKVIFERMKIEKEEGRGIDMTEGSRVPADQPRPVMDPAATITENIGSESQSAVLETSEHEAVRVRVNSLNERLKKLNLFSSVLNIWSLMSLTWHLLYLSQWLHVTQ